MDDKKRKDLETYPYPYHYTLTLYPPLPSTLLYPPLPLSEEALSKVDDKKRKDLENLKKQNERIALIQKGKCLEMVMCVLR